VNGKADYVRAKAAGPINGHHCHWPGCDKHVPPAMWGCKPHWFRLPAAIRRKIWSAFKPGQEISKRPPPEYVEAAREAQAWITANFPTSTPPADLFAAAPEQ
jgi:hypothetical protein